MICNCNSFELPTISFVGGETQDFIFHIYHTNSNRPHSLGGCSCNFAIVNHVNRHGAPLLSEPMSISYDEELATDNILSITLNSLDTVDLEGKYIYQITIKDSDGRAEIPKQGYLYITNNINKEFTKGV